MYTCTVQLKQAPVHAYMASVHACMAPVVYIAPALSGAGGTTCAWGAGGTHVPCVSQVPLCVSARGLGLDAGAAQAGAIAGGPGYHQAG